MKVKIFTTGGTFDKEYDPIKEQVTVRETHIAEILQIGRSIVEVDIEPLMAIDSLHMTEDERAYIADKCALAPEKHIVITHGTSTADKTAKVIASRDINDKTIVLVGAMIPYMVVRSDALFNIGAALAFAQSLKPGVYIAINGRYFNYDNVIKNTTTGIFEEIRPNSTPL